MQLYLDMNIYYRVFDDQSQPRINSETKAIEVIFKLVEKWKYNLCWSYILERENNANPADDLKEDVKIISNMISNTYLKWQKEIENIALEIMKNSNSKSLDSLHLACAIYYKCDYFITCDDRFIKTINNNKEKLKDIINHIEIVNPVEFIGKEMDKNDSE